VALGIFVAFDTDEPVGVAEAPIAVGVRTAGRVDNGVVNDVHWDDAVASHDISRSRLIEPVVENGLAAAPSSRVGTTG
jgi:hypothetical protein